MAAGRLLYGKSVMFNIDIDIDIDTDVDIDIVGNEIGLDWARGSW